MKMLIQYVSKDGAGGSAKVCVEVRTEFSGIAESDQFYIGA